MCTLPAHNMPWNAVCVTKKPGNFGKSGKITFYFILTLIPEYCYSKPNSTSFFNFSLFSWRRRQQFMAYLQQKEKNIRFYIVGSTEIFGWQCQYMVYLYITQEGRMIWGDQYNQSNLNEKSKPREETTIDRAANVDLWQKRQPQWQPHH